MSLKPISRRLLEFFVDDSVFHNRTLLLLYYQGIIPYKPFDMQCLMLISDDMFEENLPKIVQNSQNFVVGLSGGADSLCLTMLLNRYAVKHQKNMTACFVDHKLRQESSEEILPIIDILKQNKIKYEVLTWNHDIDIGGNIEKKARENRYRLLFEFCEKTASNLLFIAHNKCDQWETFFMRLSKGSGLLGLSCMKPLIKFENNFIIRPMLNFSPNDIRETLKSRFQISNYVLDPSNDDPKFERVRWRKTYDLLEQLDLTMDKVLKTVHRLQTANECLDNLAKKLSNEIFDGKYIDIKKYSSLEKELKIRVLNCVIHEVLGQHKLVSRSLLNRISEEICLKTFSATNIASLVFRRDKTKNVKISKEQR